MSGLIIKDQVKTVTHTRTNTDTNTNIIFFIPVGMDPKLVLVLASPDLQLQLRPSIWDLGLIRILKR